MDYGQLIIALLSNPAAGDLADGAREERYYREHDPAWIGRMADAWHAVRRRFGVSPAPTDAKAA